MGIERIAYEHIVAKLDAQRVDLANLRGQARASAAVTGLIGAVFANILGSDFPACVFHSNFYFGFSFEAIALFATFSGSIYFSIMTLIGWKDVTFSFDAEKMTRNGSKHASNANFFASYARDGEFFFKENEERINAAQNNLWWAMVLGWSQIIPWIMMLTEAKT